MPERLKRLGGAVGRLLVAVWRGAGELLAGAWRGLVKVSRLWETNRAVRGRERERRAELECLGRMTYVLYKRNLVRNADLLAQCAKIHELDTEIDRLLERADQIRVARPIPAEEAAPRVADTPLEAGGTAGGPPLGMESEPT